MKIKYFRHEYWSVLYKIREKIKRLYITCRHIWNFDISIDQIHNQKAEKNMAEFLKDQRKLWPISARRPKNAANSPSGVPSGTSYGTPFDFLRFFGNFHTFLTTNCCISTKLSLIVCLICQYARCDCKLRMVL